MRVVTNTGPLIALAKIGQLTLLQHLFTAVSIPPAVHRELLAKTGSEAVQLETALSGFIRITETPPLQASVKIATAALDIGEQQAIALAYEQKTMLIIDERLGREAARRLGLTITGSIGVILKAKASGLILAANPLIHNMRRQGYWISDDLLRIATQLAGEDEG